MFRSPISNSEKIYFPNVHNLFQNDNLLKIVLKVGTVVSMIYALIQDLFYNLRCAVQYFKTEQRSMSPFDPSEENVEKIRSFLLEHAPELFTGSIRSRSRSPNSNIVHYGTKIGGVFSLKDLPNLIFKMDTIFKKRLDSIRPMGMSVEKRFKNISRAQEICSEGQFLHLKIPKSVLFDVTPTERARGRKFQILAQQMFSPIKTGKDNLKLRDAALQDVIIKELVEFILKTGFYDVDDRNLLVIEEDGVRKIGVIDYEYVDLDKLRLAFHGGSVSGNRKATIQGLFNILPGKTDVINSVLIENGKKDLTCDV